MQPLDDPLSRLLSDAAKHHASEPLPALTQSMEDAVIRAWRAGPDRSPFGRFEGLLAPGLIAAGAAVALAVAVNFQALIGGTDSQTVELERQIADASSQIAMLP